MHEVQYYKYDVNKYPFIELLKKLFEIDNLSQIHTLIPTDNTSARSPNGLFTNENDDETLLHQQFYNQLKVGWPEFKETYINLICKVRREILQTEEIIYQTTPTFRVQLPNNIAVGGNSFDEVDKYGWHRDTDAEYNHPPFEKNFLVPLTDASESASLYIETGRGTNRFEVARMKTGEFFQFRGGECVHGNKPNQTGQSRVSLDFRVVLKKDYDEGSTRSSKLSGKKFVVGDYYSLLETMRAR